MCEPHTLRTASRIVTIISPERLAAFGASLFISGGLVSALPYPDPWVIFADLTPEKGTMFKGHYRHYGGEIAEGTPWISAVALLCALAVAVWAVRSGASWLDAAGLGLTNLGYFLAIAGLATGHFCVLGLMRRWQVFFAAALMWLTGMILVNV